MPEINVRFPLDRLPRITACCSVGERPSCEDTWWMIAEIQVLRARLRDLQVSPEFPSDLV